MKLLFSLLLILYFFLHSLLAQPGVKQFISRHLTGTRFYRLFYNTFALLSLIPVWWVYRLTEKSVLVDLPTWISFLAWAGFVFGCLLLLLALKQYSLGEFSGWAYMTDAPSVSQELNTHGLNRYVRHPLYTASFIILWSWCLTALTDVGLILVTIASLYLYIGTILEERKLIQTFGKAYLEYKSQTPRFFPFEANHRFEK